VIAIDSGAAGDLCVGKTPGLLFRGEKRDVLAQPGESLECLTRCVG
jgi:hypothetical protein